MKVVPGTDSSVRSYNMESYIGVIVRNVDSFHYTVKKLAPGAKGKKEKVSSFQRMTTFESTPLSSGGIRMGDLTLDQQRRLEEGAEEKA